MMISRVCLIIVVFFIVGYEQQGVCNSKWRTVLRTNEYGSTSGSKEDLIDYVLSGADLRMTVHGLDYGGDVTMSANNAYITTSGNDICSQSILHIGKASWDSFTSDVYWRFLLVCTTGHVNQAQWYVGDHTKPDHDTTTRHKITWYIRTVGCNEYSNASKPIFCSTLTCGPVENLFDAIATGSDLRVVDEGLGYTTTLEHAAYSKRKKIVGAESIWSVSQIGKDDHAEFAGDAFWWFTLWASEGTVDMSRWRVGEHKSLGHGKASFEINWYSDTCWQLAYSHDGNGEAVDGSLDLLKAAILSGHRVRVVIGPYGIEADNLLIRNEHVSAQLLGHISKKDVDAFQDDVYWFWQHVATTGEVETIRPKVGDAKYKQISGGRHSIKWFIDTRNWKRRISTYKSKTISQKSKIDLIESILDGSYVRLVVKFDDNNIMALQANNVGFNRNKTEVYAQSIKNVGHFYPAGSVREFHSKPYWDFMSLTTSGVLIQSRWTVGIYESRGKETRTNVHMEWFTN